MSISYIVFDIETSNIFQEVHSNDPAALDLALLAAYDSRTNEYSSYLKADLPKFWKLIEGVDMLVTYNGDHFDIPLLNKYYPGDLTKMHSLDLLKEVQNVLGRRLKLDSIAEATLGEKKSAHGLQSIKWWREGKVELVREYCLKDVEITKRIFDYGLKNGTIKYIDLGKPKDLKLRTSHWLSPKKSQVTQTLGF